MDLLKNLLLILGIPLLFTSLWPIRRTIAAIPRGRIRNMWRALFFLICFFIVGYVGYSYTFWDVCNETSDLIVPVIFFGGAVFVFLVCLLSRQTAENFRRIFILEQESTIDALTGVYNRRYFDRRLYEEFARSKRYNEPFSLVMVDVDHFKKINDHWGHPVGDLVLKRFAELIRLSLREADVVCRYGGEELGLILPHTELKAALAIAEKLRRKIAGNEMLTEDAAGGKGAVRVTVSLGVAGLRSEISSADNMLALADKALYFAKQSGRDCVKSCDDLVDETKC